MYGGFREFDISCKEAKKWVGFRDFIMVYKQVNNFLGVSSVFKIVVTRDDQFLITSSCGKNCNLTKWSIQNKRRLKTWASGINHEVCS